MPINIQRPSTRDVTKLNPREVLYIKGDADTDGSQRIIMTDDPEFRDLPQFQERIAGTFVTGAVTFSNAGFVLDSVSQTIAIDETGEFIRVGF